MFLILIEGYRSVSYEWLLSKFPSTQLILTSFVSALEDSFPVHILGDWIVFVQHDSPPSFPCHCLFFHPLGCLLCLLFHLFRYVLCLFCLLRCLLCLYFSLFRCLLCLFFYPFRCLLCLYFSLLRYVLCLFFCFRAVLYLYLILHQIIIYQRKVRSIRIKLTDCYTFAKSYLNLLQSRYS